MVLDICSIANSKPLEAPNAVFCSEAYGYSTVPIEGVFYNRYRPGKVDTETSALGANSVVGR